MVNRIAKETANSVTRFTDESLLLTSKRHFKQNSLRSPDLVFIESVHKYLYKNIELTSVTTWLGGFFAKFDSNFQAAVSSNNSNSVYYQMSPLEIISAWRLIADSGTKTHLEIENYLLAGIYPSDAKALHALTYIHEVIDIFKVTKDNSHPEVRIFSSELNLAGTVDWVVETPHGLIIYDWKTSKSLYRDRAKYYAQLNTYAYILEHYYGYHVAGLRLVHLKPNCHEVHVVPKNFKQIKEFINSSQSNPGS